jgi:lipopolysaccharide export system protein LptA
MNKLSRHSLAARRLTILLSITLALLVQANTWAAENLEKIYIDADYMQLNIDTGYSVYTGNVNIKQGELKLTGDKVTIQQNKEEVERITVNGKPAQYNHVTEKGENIQAESEQMVYTASESKLVMTGNANLKQPDHQVSSQKIVYDTQKNIVIAGDKGEKSATDPDGSQRVNITLTPKKDPAE